MEVAPQKSDAALAVELAQKLVVILADFDPETRRRAVTAAQALLGDQPIASQRLERDEKRSSGVDLAAFFGSAESQKPADNAYMCAAYHFSIYGTAAFSLAELRGIAAEAGVVLPDRLDMTLKQAGKSGRKLFQSAGRDRYKPTATAGVLFKERWNVAPGRASKLEDNV
ncbi:MAG TPA: hypothetical protein VD997_08295 [Phycisphaerales bacterium]|nr:hypothetical protein [Phycisphaerales bacterium]